MEGRDLYAAIFQRKSVRRYDVTPLADDTLEGIRDRLQTLTPLHKDIATEFAILPPDVVNRRMQPPAPHYIAAFSEVNDGHLSNVGFMLQQMDLFLSANGMGSCWAGIPTLTKEGLARSKLKFVILMLFGKPDETLHRASTSEFKRKPLKVISDISGADDLLEAARLAPSARNAQPWFFTGHERVVHAYYRKPNLLSGLLTKKYPPIDVGISLCHLKLSAERLGNETEIVFDDPQDNAFSEHVYVASLHLK